MISFAFFNEKKNCKVVLFCYLLVCVLIICCSGFLAIFILFFSRLFNFFAEYRNKLIELNFQLYRNLPSSCSSSLSTYLLTVMARQSIAYARSTGKVLVLREKII